MIPADSSFENVLETDNHSDTNHSQRLDRKRLNTTHAPKTADSALIRSLFTSLMNRIDAWGVTFIICIMVFYLHDAISLETVFLSVAMAGMYWLGYVVNDYFDAPFDSHDKTKVQHNVFVKHPVSPRVAKTGFLAIGVLFLLAFTQFGLRGGVIFGVSLFVMWAYSAPPFRLKSRPGLDLLTHALFVQTFSYLSCLLLIRAEWTSADLALLGVNFLASLSGQLAQQLRDFQVDSDTDTNFATTVGRRTTVTFLRVVTFALMLLVFVALVTGTIPLYLAPFAAAFVPASIQRLRGHGIGPRFRRVAPYATVGALFYLVLLLTFSL
jgi:4-hydroxybenzoate polyprenyltransferase